MNAKQKKTVKQTYIVACADTDGEIELYRVRAKSPKEVREAIMGRSVFSNSQELFDEVFTLTIRPEKHIISIR